MDYAIFLKADGVIRRRSRLMFFLDQENWKRGCNQKAPDRDAFAITDF